MSDKFNDDGFKKHVFLSQRLYVPENEIWDKIKETLSNKFHNTPVYDETYIKAKVRKFSGVIKTNFLDDEVPKENEHYTCIACITIDSVMRMEKTNYPEVYLQECKYRMKMKK